MLGSGGWGVVGVCAPMENGGGGLETRPSVPICTPNTPWWSGWHPAAPSVSGLPPHPCMQGRTGRAGATVASRRRPDAAFRWRPTLGRTRRRRRAGGWKRMATTPHERSHTGSMTHHALLCQCERCIPGERQHEEAGAAVVATARGPGTERHPAHPWTYRRSWCFGVRRMCTAVSGRALANHRPKDQHHADLVYTAAGHKYGCKTIGFPPTSVRTCQAPLWQGAIS